MTTLVEYTEAVALLVPGEHGLADVDATLEKAVRQAMRTHSRYDPHVVIEDVPGNGGREYTLSGLAAWDLKFSRVTAVEYPAGNNPPDMIDPEDYAIYAGPAGPVLRLEQDIPADAVFRLTYAALHECDADDCTVPAADEEAVQALCASYYASILAARYAISQDNTIAADSVDQISKRREYTAVAKAYREQYEKSFGMSGGVKPACAIQDQDVNGPYNQDRLTHPGRWR